MSMTSSLNVIHCPTSEENIFVLRYPLLNNSLHVGTKLVVKQNQVAIIVDNGTILDILEEGIHVLNSNTLPKFAAHKHWSKHYNSTFYCEIYFVSLLLFENLKWGMVNSLIIRDNDFGSISIKCFGNFNFRVSNPEIFMQELFGKIAEFNNEDIALYLKTLIITGLTDTLLETRISALDFITNYDQFTIEDYEIIQNKFSNCGLYLQQLNIENISMPSEIEKLLEIKISEKIENKQPIIKQSLPINHPINAGTIHSSEMKKMFNFTHDLTITCVNCGSTIAKNFKYCPQCGVENKEIAKECPNCHNIVAFKANFCPDCGTKLFDKNNVVICKYCGKIVSETDLYCPDCGKSL